MQRSPSLVSFKCALTPIFRCESKITFATVLKTIDEKNLTYNHFLLKKFQRSSKNEIRACGSTNVGVQALTPNDTSFSS